MNNSTVKVRNFIPCSYTLPAGVTRVTLDSNSYGILSRSGRALASKGQSVPELAPIATIRENGLFYSKFAIGGVEVLYRFNKFANRATNENPHEFLMDEKVAKSIYEPMEANYSDMASAFSK